MLVAQNYKSVTLYATYHKHITTSYHDGQFSGAMFIQEDSYSPLELLIRINIDRCGKIAVHRSEGNLKVSEINELHQALAMRMMSVLKDQRHWIAEHDRLKIPNLEQELELLSFFHALPHFKSIEWFEVKDFIELLDESVKKRVERLEHFHDFITFLAGKHSAKSVLRTLYENFTNAIEHDSYYDPMGDFIICRSFDDPNLVCRLLRLPIRHVFSDGMALKESIRFFRWLQKYHHASSIVRVLEVSIDYRGNFLAPIWVDIMRMADGLIQTEYRVLSQEYQKMGLNAQKLHDELIRIHRKIESKKRFENYVYPYSDQELQMEMRLHHLDFVLVKERIELNRMGDTLHNCLFGYDQLVREKKCYIVGVFRENKLTYAIEFDGKSILQSSGKYNSDVLDDDQWIIQQWAASSVKAMALSTPEII